MFRVALDDDELLCDAGLDDQGNIVLILSLCGCVIEQASAADCVSVIKTAVKNTKHLIALFDEEFVKGAVQHEIRKQCRSEFDRAYQLAMLLEDQKYYFGLKDDGSERQVVVRTDSDEYWRVVLHRANLSLDDLIFAIKENDHESALSGRLMWGQLKASGTEPNWWIELDL